MNQEHPLAASTPLCCVDYCQNSFTGTGGMVTNNYKCGQSPFTAESMWKLSKQKKTAHSIREMQSIRKHSN